MQQRRVSNAERLVDAVDDYEFPILAGLLRTDVGEHAREELIALLARRFQPRATRRPVRVTARIIGLNIDQSVDIRDISATGIRVAVDKDAPFPRNPGDVWVRLSTDDGVMELPLAFIRVVLTHLGEFEAAFQFDKISGHQATSLDKLRDLIGVDT
jgi:hypothetical protein